MQTDRYVSVQRAAKIAGLTEKQILGMLDIQIYPGLKLRYKRKGDRILIDRDSVTEIFLGYTGGWD